MLEESFIHIPGVGRDTERSLWEQGCTDWQTFLDQPNEFRTGHVAANAVVSYLKKSQDALQQKNHQFFAKGLRQTNAWRAWDSFKTTCAYLDIETDGGRTTQSVTVIGIWDGEFHAFVAEDNINDFRDAISHYNMIVTFFGSGFDLPILMKKYRSVIWDQLHLDLMHTARALGVRGGLKKIEQMYGITRPEGVIGLNGLDAVRLWRQARFGNKRALQTLLDYNRADVENLETLAQKMIAQLWELTRHGVLPERAEVSL